MGSIEISEHLKGTVIDAVHFKNQRLEENHCQKVEKYLQTEVLIAWQEEILGM